MTWKCRMFGHRWMTSWGRRMRGCRWCYKRQVKIRGPENEHGWWNPVWADNTYPLHADPSLDPTPMISDDPEHMTTVGKNHRDRQLWAKLWESPNV